MKPVFLITSARYCTALDLYPNAETDTQLEHIATVIIRMTDLSE